MSVRVNELAKDLGKTSKEVLDILQKNNVEVKSNLSNVTDEQVSIVKKALAPKPAVEASTESKSAEGAPVQQKKRIAAVYRPQNSSQKGRPSGARTGQGQRPARPAGNGAGMQARQTTGTAQGRQQEALQARSAAQSRPMPPTQGVKASPGSRPMPQKPLQPSGTLKPLQGTVRQPQAAGEGAGQTASAQTSMQKTAQLQPSKAVKQPQEQAAGSAQQENGKQTEAVRQPQLSESRQTTVQAAFGQTSDAAAVKSEAAQQEMRTAQYSGRSQNQTGGTATREGRPAQGRSYQEGREQGNRDGGRGQGSRDGGNRQGNRDGRSGQGGYQGSRDGGNRPGGYQGSRDGRSGQGGYQGNRDGGRGQGSRDGRSGQGGYQGGRDNRGGQGGRGLNIPKPSFDTPLAQKQQNTKASKNAYKKEHDAKKDRDGELRGKSARSGKGVKAPVMQQPRKEDAKVEEVKTIIIPEFITIKELADKMKLQPSAIVKKLFLQGTIVTINQEIDFDKAEEIAMEYDILCEKEKKINVIEELLKEDEEDEASMVSRPPVICVMGHVDHGKTSLLDAIRETNVTAREAGGITQHIGAYVVEANGQKITFLDTPGHEAFTAMRMRGAQATDIAILVVAADDGVMPQTVEAINHAKAAGVEIIVAVNKIDKPSANVERVKQELSEHELIPEDWGGNTVFVPVSAHTKEGIPELLEMILLTAEVKELKANPNRKARGLVIEAQLDKGRGPVATVLVQKGILKIGDCVAAGSCYGRVRAMMDDKGNRVKEAGPSTPVEILGLNDVPNAGEVFVSQQNEKEARSFAETFIAEGKNKLIEDTKAKLSLDDLFSQIKAGNVKELPIIVKADVQGSVEAVKQSLLKLSNEEVMVKVIHGGVGTINESDVTLASASNAIIIGFNVRPDATAKSTADREKVDMRLYRVIYQAIEDVESAMKGMLDPIFEEQVTGHAVVRQTFKASGVGTIAGSYILDGKIVRGCKVRISRDGEQIFEGALASLKRFKDDVKEVNAGYECGLVFDSFNDLQEDDTIEAYIMVEVPR